MADEKIRYVLDVDDKGTPKIVKFGEASGKAGKQAQTAFDKFGEGVSKAADKIPGLASSLDMARSAANALSNPLVAIPAALVTGALVAGKFASANAEMVTEMSHLSAQTGLTVNELLAFKRIGGPLGISVETVANASSKLSLNLSKNSATLKELGVTSQNPIEAMAQVADKFASSTSASYRARLANEAFGKSWKELAPMLAEGGKQIRDAAGSGMLSSGMIDRYKEIHERTVEIEKTWPKIKGAIGDVASGPLDDVLGMMVEVAKYETSWVSDFRKMQSVKAIVSVEQTFTQGARKEFSGIGRKGTSNEIDAEKALTDFKKLSAEQRATIMLGYYNDEKSIITQSLATKMQAIVLADKKEEAEQERKSKLELENLGKAEAAKEKAIQQSQANQQKAQSFIASNRQALIEKSVYLKSYNSLTAQGVATEVAAVSAAADQEAAKESAKYNEMKSMAGVSSAQIVEIEHQKTAKLAEIQDSAAAKISEIYRKINNAAVLESAKSYSATEKTLDGVQAQIDDAEKKKNEALLRGAKASREIYAIDEAQREKQYAAIAQSFAPLQSTLQSFSSSLLAGQATMASFGESFKAMIIGMVAEVTANAAIFGILNIFSGGAAGSFLGGLSGLSSLVLGSFAVGTRALPATGPIIAHKDEAIFPAPVSRAMRAGDWGPAMRFMGQGGSSSTTSTSSQTNHITVNVAGTNASPDDIAKSLSRALQVQRRKGARSSF